MKKLTSLLIALLMGFSLNVSSVMAESTNVVQPDKVVTEMIVEPDVKQIKAEDNYVFNDGSYLVDKLSLVGTRLEDKAVIVTRNGIYVDGRESDSLEIMIKGVLVANLVEGVIIYATGYSGAKLTALTIKAIVTLVSAHPVGFLILVVLAAVTAAVVLSYETSTGNECILSPSGGYTCKYSI